MISFLKNPTRIVRKVDEVVTAWETLAPTATFAGMTLAEFRTAVEPSKAERIRTAELEAELSGAAGRRAQADLNTNEKLKLVVAAVKGDPAHGENSALYRAMGYIPLGERASGLTRKAAAAEAPVGNN
ncbi:MAG: hypothetical protein FGM15_10120 [Chthoniobacterales bacterium]|nr:hypothetical protein [Chthoniobacterales bacterium]